MVELYLPAPICLHDIVLNKLSTGTTLPYYVVTVIMGFYFSNSSGTIKVAIETLYCYNLTHIYSTKSVGKPLR
jgi:hypothetical protein